MPSPVAHLGAGYAVYRLYRDRLPVDRRRIWTLPLQVLLVMGLSLLPDLDVIPALILGDMQAYHNNISHSLIFAFPAALVCAAAFHWIYRARFGIWFLVSFLSYALHVLMDSFSGTRGVLLLWPLVQERFAGPVQLFVGVQWGLGWFTIWHLWTFLSEALFTVIVIAAVTALQRRKSRELPSVSFD